jgi:hypothetical protein
MKRIYLCLLLCASFLNHAFAQTIWTGATGSNWETPTNWSPNSVPNATDDVIIPNTNNDPIVIAGTEARAKSIWVQTGSSLTIQSTAKLSIYGAKALFGTISCALFNEGNVNNSGQLVLNNPALPSIGGLFNLASFTNNTGGQVLINSFSSNGIALLHKGSQFTNAGILAIGGGEGVGSVGIDNGGTFDNNSGGQIFIDKTSNTALFNNVGGTFTNKANIKIGELFAVGSYGLRNDATFNNNAGGQIRINLSTAAGLYNKAGTFTNVAGIVIGASATIGSHGLRNEATFNNNTGGEIKIDRSTSIGLSNNDGTFTNSARILIGATATVGSYGLYNPATFNNNAGGEISIDNTTFAGLFNGLNNSFIVSANFTNKAQIVIGANTSVNQYGIYNTATFNNNTAGQIRIDGSTNSGLLNGGVGTFINAAGIVIGGTTAVGSYGLRNTATFTNSNEGHIKIDRSTNFGLYNTVGTFTNEASIVIGATTSSGPFGLLNTATFNNTTGGVIKIDNVTSVGLINNSGTFTNYATIEIGSSGTIGGIGLRNQAIFNNTNGAIKIDNVNNSGLYNGSGIFTNTAAINIGANAAVGLYGIWNQSTFNNNTGGDIHIDGSANIGLFNFTGGAFTNTAGIVIGANASAGSTGLWNMATFHNNSGGAIEIDNTTTVGLFNDAGSSYTGTFTNVASLIIGAKVSVGNVGIHNRSVFSNTTGGSIHIDNTKSNGLFNNINSGYTVTFTNAATIAIGIKAAVGSYGLRNLTSFVNDPCATLTLFAALNNTASIINQGMLTVNTTQAHTNSGFTNDGIIAYLQGNPVPNVTNNALIAAPLSGCGYNISSALLMGGNNTFSIDGTWYQDAALTNGVATYSNDNTVSVALELGSTYPLYFKVTDPVNGCSRVVSVSVTLKERPNVGLSTQTPIVTEGQSVTLTASGAATYSWSTGATGNQITVVPPLGNTLYTVTGTGINGCTGSVSLNIWVNPANLLVSGPAKLCVKSTPPTNTVVTLPVTMQVSGGLAPYTYNWSYKAPNSTSYKTIATKGATIGKVSFSPVAGMATLNLTGTKGNLYGLQGYKIRLTVMSNSQTSSAETLLDGSCLLGTISSITMNANSGNLNEIEDESRIYVLAYPNPVVDVLQVKIGGLQKKALVNLVDMQGRTVRRLQITPVDGLNQLKVPVTGLAGGLYTLQVVTADGLIRQQKVLKMQ